MRILFLRPNSGIPVAPPPIGLMYLVGYLRHTRPHQDEITVLDARSELSSDEEVVEAIQKAAPDLVGITAKAARPTIPVAFAIIRNMAASLPSRGSRVSRCHRHPSVGTQEFYLILGLAHRSHAQASDHTSMSVASLPH